MNLSTDIASHSLSEALKIKARNALSNALDAHRKELSTYESLKNLGEVIGTEYGDRVLFELIQNAHDAHAIGENGAITIKFEKISDTEGLDLSRFSAAPGARLDHLAFEGDRAFPAQC